MWKNWMQPSKGLGTAWQFAKINSHSFFLNRLLFETNVTKVISKNVLVKSSEST